MLVEVLIQGRWQTNPTATVVPGEGQNHFFVTLRGVPKQAKLAGYQGIRVRLNGRLPRQVEPRGHWGNSSDLTATLRVEVLF